MAWHSPDSTARIDSHETHADIMPVDFSDETIIFTKMNILVQSGTFARSQNNGLAPSVLALLQGGPDHH
ncbi:flagellin [Thiovibrio frasassiensis]|uniref:Flagellin n=1 Tax=Thiovibrio frasassiensis TaxID=2984131 RepID=A0A9X4MHT0_9BACT|nr:flagellin [Thiovibrio frasassiensis]MDG4475099.1 flagellin [Thiovibrio frasassiensis]